MTIPTFSSMRLRIALISILSLGLSLSAHAAAPTIDNLPATAATNDNATESNPFAGVDLDDPDGDNVTVTITVDDDRGTLTSLGVFTKSATDTYTYTGPDGTAETRLRQIDFVPVENRIPIGTTEDTTITVKIEDATDEASDTTVITVTPVDDDPTLSLGSSSGDVDDDGTIKPFNATDPEIAADPSIDELDGQTVTLTVTIDPVDGSYGPVDLGDFTTSSLANFTAGAAGVYTTSASTPAVAINRLKELVFEPEENAFTPETTEDVVISVVVTDATSNDSPTRSFTLTITSINDDPTLAALGGQIDIFDNVTTTTPFTAGTIEDDDFNAAIEVTVTVVPDNTGTMTNLGGFTSPTTGTYTFTGSPTAATTALTGLVFVPANNRISPGLDEDTTLTVTITDNIISTTPPSRTRTVNVESLNDNPVLSPAGPFAPVTMTGGSSIQPFLSITSLEDADFEITTGTGGIGGTGSADQFTATITLSPSPYGTIISDDFDGSGATYTYEGLRSDVLEAIQNVQYQAPGVTATFTISVSVEDDYSGTSTAVSASANVTQPNPGITGLITSGQQLADDGSIFPFATALFNAFGGSDRIVEVSLGVDAKGAFQNLGPFIKVGSVYRMTGDSIAATDAIRGLRFVPTPNRITGASEDVALEIAVYETAGDAVPLFAAPDVVVKVFPTNDAPEIVTTNPIIRINDDNITTSPFASLSVADLDEGGAQLVVLEITLIGENPDTNVPVAGGGTLIEPTSSGYLSIGATTYPNITYTLTGTPTQVTTAMQALVFIPGDPAPAPDRWSLGQIETITFTLEVEDFIVAGTPAGGSDFDDNTKVIVTYVNGAPFIDNVPSPSQQPYPIAGSTAGSEPFKDIEVRDDDPTITFTITLDDEDKGTLTNLGGFSDSGGGVYTMTGTPANIQTDLQALVYVVGTVSPPTTFTLSATDPAPASNNRTIDFEVFIREQNISHIVTVATDNASGDAVIPGTLRQALSLAGINDSIVFEFAVEDYPVVIHLQQPLTVGTSVSIIGSGVDQLTISGDSDQDGSGDVSLFIVDENVEFTIEQITLADGLAASYGGAITANPNSSLTARYCSFENNSAGQYGGAIDVNQGQLLVEGCLFIDNSVLGSGAAAGGAISVYTNTASIIRNSTFVGNVQGNSGGGGGASIYAQNSIPDTEFNLLVEHCTFSANVDAAASGSAILSSFPNTVVQVRNNIFSEPAGLAGNVLDEVGSGDFESLGGNIATDGTLTAYTQGGTTQNTAILDATIDSLSEPLADLKLLPLAYNGGATLTMALDAGSSAIDTAIAVVPVSDGPGIDQRGVWRDATPDVGAYEVGTYTRVNINEIYVQGDATEDFIEFYNPRDSESLDLAGLELWIDGALIDTFTTNVMSKGSGYVWPYLPTATLAEKALATTFDLNEEKGLIELRNSDGQVLLSVSYIGEFSLSGTDVDNDDESITRYPTFEGGFIPHQRAVTRVGSPAQDTSPGNDITGLPLNGGNAPPIAVVDTDESGDPAYSILATDTLNIDVLANDVEFDLADTLKITEVMVVSSSDVVNQELFAINASGAITLADLPTPGTPPVGGIDTTYDAVDISVTIATDELSIDYDPTASDLIIGLAEGESITDIWAYTIADFDSSDVQLSRGLTTPDQETNIEKATSYFTVTVTGVNEAPEADPDSASTTENQAIRLLADEDLLSNPSFAFGDLAADFMDYNASGVLVPLLPPFPTIALLANDDDVDSDDDKTTLLLVSVHPTAVSEPTEQIYTEKGALVTLDLRTNREETSIIYDPRPSTDLNKLSAGEVATDCFYYTILDMHGEDSIAKVTLTITGVNDAPTATADTGFCTDEDSTLDIDGADLLENDYDTDVNGLAGDDVPFISQVDALSAGGATITFNGTDIFYDPVTMDTFKELSRNEFIFDTFTYTLEDPTGATSVATVTVKVEGRNDAPVASNDLLEIFENEATLVEAVDGLLFNDVEVDVNSSPPDDDPWVIPQREVTTPLGAALNIFADGSFTYNANSAAIDSLIQGEVVAETFPYIVTDNSRTRAVDDSFTVEANQTDIALPVLVNDAVVGSAPIAIVSYGEDSSDSNNTIIESADHSLRDGLLVLVKGYTGTASYNGVFPITSIDADHFSIPVAFDSGASTTSGTWQPWFEITAVGPTDQAGAITILDGQTILYTPASNFYGTETFTYTIEDGVGGQDVGAVSVLNIIFTENGAIRANADAYSVGIDVVDFPVDVLANDGTLPALGSDFTITEVSPASSGLEIVAGGQSLTYSAPSAPTTEVFTYTVSGGGTSTAQATVTFTVEDLTGLLGGNEDNYFVVEGSSDVVLSVLGNDATLPGAPTSLTLVDVQYPGTGSAIRSGNTIIYSTPPSPYRSVDTFTYTSINSVGATTLTTVNVNVVEDTQEFHATDDKYTVVAGSSMILLPVLSNDGTVQNESATVAVSALGLDLVAPADRNRVNIADGNVFIEYTPPATPTIVPEMFNYEISIGTIERREATITIDVIDRADIAPIAVDDFYDVERDSGPHTLAVLSNDLPYADAGWVRTVKSPSTPANGTVAIVGETSVSYTPADGFFGLDTFTYVVEDAYGQTDTGTVTVQVGGLVTSPDSYVVLENSLDNPFPVLLNDDWLNRYAADYTVVAFDPSAALIEASDTDAVGTISIDGTEPNNQLLYTPEPDFVGVEYFTYTVVDENGGTLTGIVTVEVISEESDRGFADLRVEITGVNDSPVLGGTEDDSITDKETTFPFDTVTLSDVDFGGNQLQTVTVEFDPSLGAITFSSAVPAFVLQSPGVYQVVGTPAQVVAALRSIEFTPTENIRPPVYYDAVFTLTITDGYIATPIVDLTTVTILAINDAPTGVDDAYSTEETQAIRLLADTTLLPPVVFDFGDLASNFKDLDAMGVEQTYLPELQNVNLLANDDDVDIDDDNTTIEIVNVHTTATRVNQITATSALGASVVLDIRAVRAETSILYDPRGSAILNALAAGETIVDTFYYTVVDQHGAEDQALVSITVTGVNDAPTANGEGGFELNEDGSITLDGSLILSNDTDPDKDGNSPNDAPIILSVPPKSIAGATLTLTAGGDIIYNPDDMEEFESLARNEFLEDSFTYTISDEMGGTSQAVIELLVEGINDAPVAGDDALAILENDTQTRDRATGLISNDSDVDMGIIFNTGDPNDDPWIIPQREQTSPLGAAFFIETDGSYSYDANSRAIDSLFENEIAVETFPYVIIDNSRLSAAQDSFKVLTDSIQVVLPVLSNDDVAGSVPVAIDGFTEDFADAQRVIVESFEHPLREGMLVKIQGYAGDGDYDGVYPISVIDRDHFSVAAPYVAGANTSLGTWRPWFEVTAVTEADKDGVLEISEDGQSILYTPLAAFYGTEQFEYTIMDGVGGQDVAIVELTVLQAPLNTVLSASDDRFQIGMGESSVEVDVLANDNVLPALGSDFSITAVSVGSAGGTLLINGTDDAVIYSPNNINFVGSETFTYDVSGGGSTSAQATVTFEVIDRQGNLRAAPDAFFVIADSTNNLLDVAANDTTLPSFPVSFEVVETSTPGSGVASVVGGQVSYTPNASFTGIDTFTYTIRDASGSNVTETVTVEVVSDVDDFYARNDHYIVVAGSGNYNLDVLINDGTSGAAVSDLIIEDLGLDTQAPPDITRIDHTGAVVTYTAPASATTEVFTYEILNGFGTDPRREGTITIVVVDNLPTPTNPLDDAYHVAKNSGPHTLDVLLNDIPMPAAGWSWTITSVGGTDQGGVAVNDGGTAITYTPDDGFYGVESFTYTIVDAFGDSASATVTVTVGSQLTEPDFYTVLENSTGNDFPVLVNDDILERFSADYTISQVGTPDQGGSVVIDGSGPDNQLLYAPAANFVGEESFTYTVIDNTGAEVTETVTVLVIDEIGDRDFANFVVTLTGINDITQIGSAPDGSTTDKLSVSPFPTITISDLDEDDLQDQITVLTFDSSLGSIVATGFSQTGPGAYTMTGTPAEVQAALRAIVFTPFENVIDYIEWAGDNSVGDLDFTLSLDDLNLGPVLGDSGDAPVVDVVTINIEPINDAPTQPILFDDILVQVNAFPRAILLTPRYADVDDVIADDELVWTVEANTNSVLFNSVTIDAAKQQLVLVFATDAFGVADITIRATDRGGKFVEDTFKVTVEGPPVIELANGQTNPPTATTNSPVHATTKIYSHSFRVTNEGMLTAEAFILHLSNLGVAGETTVIVSGEYSTDERGTPTNFNDDFRSSNAVTYTSVGVGEYALKYDIPLELDESVVVHVTYRVISVAYHTVQPDIRVELTTSTPEAGFGLALSSMDTMTNGEVGLEFVVEAGRSYQLEYTSDLGGVWMPWALVIPVNDFDRTYEVIDDGLYTDPHPSLAPDRFYRLVDITAP
ncbi:MAG: Ig-like domain-containing protein [Opitutaceae bacterium]